MEGFILSIAPFFWALAAILGACIVVYFIVKEVWPAVIVSIVVTVVIAICWYTAATGFFVPVNQLALLVDNSNGSIIGQMLPAGIQHRSLFNTDYFFYPGATQEEWCSEYTPSVEGGYEVKLTICTYYDAANTDWAKVFTQTNKRNSDDIYAYWQNQLRTIVANTIKDFKSTDLTDFRPKVEEALTSSMGAWFRDKGILVVSIRLPNWDYSNPAVAAAFDNTATSQAGAQQAKSNMDKAESERTLQLYMADTQNKVLNAIATGGAQALDILGIKDQQARAWYLVQRDILTLLASRPNATIVVSVGGQSVTIPPSAQLPATAVPGQ